MKKVRVRRGSAALEVYEMPTREVWIDAYTRLYASTDYRFFSMKKEKIFSCEELYQATLLSLRSVSPNNRSWGINILRHFCLPIV